MNRLTEFKEWFVNLNESTLDDIVSYYDENVFFSYKEKLLKIHGSSHLKLNYEEKIVYHRDYWDVGEELLLKIPLIKSLYGFFQNKLSLSFN